MQLRKFYGRTVGSALAQVKRELGPDALILETNAVPPGSPAAQMNPEARYEVLAARDPRQAAPARPVYPDVHATAPAQPAYAKPAWPRAAAPEQARTAPARPEYVDPRLETLAPAGAPPMTYTRPTPRPAAPASTAGSGQPQAANRNPLLNERTRMAPVPAMPQAEIRKPQSVFPALGEAAGDARATRPLNPNEKALWAFETETHNPQSRIRNSQSPIPPSTFSAPHSPAHRGDLLEDLGLLRSQINQLLEGDRAEERTEDFGHADVAEFHALIDQGVDHNLLAPHFRAWLEWRTADPSHRSWMGKLQGGPAAHMQGESLREWLWLAWAAQQGLDEEVAASVPTRGPQVVSLVGSTGSGKTTTLAKLASISRHIKRQNAVILTLDTMRFGATEQWRKIGRLMGIDVVEITNSIDISNAMEKWDRYDWVGIDTPGGIHPESATGILYGSILAQYPAVESMIVLPATQQESVCREQMKRYRGMGARKVLFSKMDETMRHGGIINLTMNGNWKIDSFATGCRIPEDWERASRQSLWHRVLAPQAAQGGVA